MIELTRDGSVVIHTSMYLSELLSMMILLLTLLLRNSKCIRTEVYVHIHYNITNVLFYNGMSPTSIVLVPLDHFSLVLVLVFSFEIILVSIKYVLVLLVYNNFG